MRKIIVSLFLCLFALKSFASPLVMIPPGDPLLDDVRYILREAGQSFVSLTPPISGDEILILLESIDRSLLSMPALEACRRIENALPGHFRFKNGIMAFNFNFKVALEGSLRSNTGIQWDHDSSDSEPLFSIPLTLNLKDFLQFYFEPALGTDPYFFDTKGSIWNTNLPYEAGRFDLNMPFRAFAALGGSWWNAQIGRDKISFGPGITGNLAVSDTPDYYDFFRFSFFTSRFKYSFLISQFPMDTGHLFSSGFDPNDSNNPYYDQNNPQLRSTTSRYMYFHRLDFRLFKKLSFGLSEGIMVGNSPLEVRYMNPLMIFHSFFAWRDYPSWMSGKGTNGDIVGSLFSLDLEWAIIPSMSFYGQFVMNDFATSYERKNFPDMLSPNAIGFLAGLEYARPIGSWGASFYGEFLYTYPYLYMLSSPFASFISMRRLSDIGSGKDRLRYKWIGHPEGRDALLLEFGAKFVLEPVSLCADLSMARRGEHSIFWDWQKSRETFAEASPSGIPETMYKAALEAQWQIFSMLRLSFFAAGIMVFDSGHKSGAKEFGVEAGIRLTFKY